MSGFRIFGIVLAVVGVVVAIFPGWFGPLTGGPEAPVDVFEAVERRVRGGMVLGVGLESAELHESLRSTQRQSREYTNDLRCTKPSVRSMLSRG